jgi:GNAT superfamily N-acetyltransferase
VIQHARGLNAAALDALADLERTVLAADPGRLELEWGVLRNRGGHRVEDLLWWDGVRLRGFLGLYSFAAPAVELTGMLDPGARRRGIATALLAAALPLCREGGHAPTLLVTPRTSGAARELALRRGAVLDHSEHALQLHGEPAEAPLEPRISLRPSTGEQIAAVNALLEDGFGWRPPAPPGRAAADAGRPEPSITLVAHLDGVVVATVRLTRDRDVARGEHGRLPRSSPWIPAWRVPAPPARDRPTAGSAAPPVPRPGRRRPPHTIRRCLIITE